MNTQILDYVLPFKAILAIDFDQTICLSKYPKCGPMRPGASSVIRRFAEQGYGIVINTCREGLALADAINWLHDHAIPYHYVNCNFPHLINEYGADCRKISADVYIDDKCLTGLPNWGEIEEIIREKFD
jgi:hypothetical protein